MAAPTPKSEFTPFSESRMSSVVQSKETPGPSAQMSPEIDRESTSDRQTADYDNAILPKDTTQWSDAQVVWCSKQEAATKSQPLLNAIIEQSGLAECDLDKDIVKAQIKELALAHGWKTKGYNNYGRTLDGKVKQIMKILARRAEKLAVSEEQRRSADVNAQADNKPVIEQSYGIDPCRQSAPRPARDPNDGFSLTKKQRLFLIGASIVLSEPADQEWLTMMFEKIRDYETKSQSNDDWAIYWAWYLDQQITLDTDRLPGIRGIIDMISTPGTSKPMLNAFQDHLQRFTKHWSFFPLSSAAGIDASAFKRCVIENKSYFGIFFFHDEHWIFIRITIFAGKNRWTAEIVDPYGDSTDAATAAHEAINAASSIWSKDPQSLFFGRWPIEVSRVSVEHELQQDKPSHGVVAVMHIAEEMALGAPIATAVDHEWELRKKAHALSKYFADNAGAYAAAIERYPLPEPRKAIKEEVNVKMENADNLIGSSGVQVKEERSCSPANEEPHAIKIKQEILDDARMLKSNQDEPIVTQDVDMNNKEAIGVGSREEPQEDGTVDEEPGIAVSVNGTQPAWSFYAPRFPGENDQEDEMLTRIQTTADDSVISFFSGNKRAASEDLDSQKASKRQKSSDEIGGDFSIPRTNRSLSESTEVIWPFGPPVVSGRSDEDSGLSTPRSDLSGPASYFGDGEEEQDIGDEIIMISDDD